MRKILVAYGVLVILVVVLAVAKFNGFSFLPSFSKATAEINKQKYSLQLANDDKKRLEGLSGRKSLAEKDGMLFIFPKKGKYGFWMKETLIPLDIIFINDNKIVYIAKNAQPPKDDKVQLPIYSPPSEVNYVLEVNGGQADKHKFKNGDTVVFTGIK